jgi:hypothetical protein
MFGGMPYGGYIGIASDSDASINANLTRIILNHIWVSVLCLSLYANNRTMVQIFYVALGGPFPGVHSTMYDCLTVSDLVGY